MKWEESLYLSSKLNVVSGIKTVCYCERIETHINETVENPHKYS